MRGLVWETAEELDLKLAQRVISIKRFETTGQISLVSLTKLAMALDIAGDLRNAFTQIPYQDIQEVINENK